MFQIRSIAQAARLCALSGLLAMGGQAHAAVHALLIGITDYRDAKIPNLQGSANDIVLMQEVLTRRFDVPARNIQSLLNGTHTQIEKAFVDLTAQIKKGDQVYIHYSGRGSWYQSPDSSQKEDLHETWVPYGARTGKSQGIDDHDILDIEVGTWLMKLHAITDDLVVVSDSSHAARVMRDAPEDGRFADGVLKLHPLRTKFKAETLPPETAGLFISAARDMEMAAEHDVKTNRHCVGSQHCHGVFTWHWAQALWASSPKESWGDVYGRALAAIEVNPQARQRPQKSGAANRYVFGGDSTR